ncbi:hypothetical protein [Neobacillus niacini]|uniref:hypothetical protein n=1 Tax=Neobacillus niacini TaxID=86668 RepID=UPI002FFFEBA3
MVKITFLDGTEVLIESDTVLNGFKNYSKEPHEFYLSGEYTDSIDGQFSKNGSRLATADARVGIAGFLLSVDCFSVGYDTEETVLYFTSAVKSVENL